MNDPMPICVPCKKTLQNSGYEVSILKGRLFHKMSCIHCGCDTNLLGTIEKVDSRRKVILAAV